MSRSGRPLRELLRQLAVLSFYGACTLGAVLMLDYALRSFATADFKRLWFLSHLARQPLPDDSADVQTPGAHSAPLRVHGRLHGPERRVSPSDQPSAMWLAWVTRTRRSGRNTYEDVICEAAELDGLRLLDDFRKSAGGKLGILPLKASTYPPETLVELFTSSDELDLLTDKALQGVKRGRIPVDLGAVLRLKTVPAPMAKVCGPGRLFGNLTYYEASLPPGSAVDVVGCLGDAQRGRSIGPCARAPGQASAQLPGPGALSVRNMAPVVRAYGNDAMSMIRIAAGLSWLALGLFSAALYKWSSTRPAPAAGDAGQRKRREDEKDDEDEEGEGRV